MAIPLERAKELKVGDRVLHRQVRGHTHRRWLTIAKIGRKFIHFSNGSQSVISLLHESSEYFLDEKSLEDWDRLQAKRVDASKMIRDIYVWSWDEESLDKLIELITSR